MNGAIAALEYETLVFTRHLTDLPGHTRRTHGVLDQSAYTLLNLLQFGGPSSIGELSEITGLDASTLNRQTAALLREDYANRIADPAGGVARKFTISDHGLDVLTAEQDASRAALASIIADWNTHDHETLTTLLARLNGDIEARTGRSWPRP